MNKKKILAVTLATAIAFPTLTAVTPYNTVSNHVYAQTTQTTQVKVPFKDLSSSYVYLDIIKEMKEKGIIHGYEDGTFRPNVTLSRQHAAVLIVRAMKVNGIELEKVREFVQPKDLTTKNPYYQEIKLLMEAGLFDTDKNGNINPSKPLTRGDMAKILTKVFDLKVKADYIFDDVVGTGYEEYIKALYSNGVTTGFENYTYRVNESLTRAHYAVFMYRAMNLDPNFNPQPIPPSKEQQPNKPKEDTPKNPSTPTVKYSDLKLTQKDKIPKPAGYVAGEHERKNNEEMQKVIAEKGYGYISSFTIDKTSVLYDSSFTFEDQLRLSAKNAGTTYEEFVNAINWAIDTGKVYKGNTFVLYFDYQNFSVVVSAVRNHAI